MFSPRRRFDGAFCCGANSKRLFSGRARVLASIFLEGVRVLCNPVGFLEPLRFRVCVDWRDPAIQILLQPVRKRVEIALAPGEALSSSPRYPLPESCYRLPKFCRASGGPRLLEINLQDDAEFQLGIVEVKTVIGAARATRGERRGEIQARARLDD